MISQARQHLDGDPGHIKRMGYEEPRHSRLGERSYVQIIRVFGRQYFIKRSPGY